MCFALSLFSACNTLRFVPKDKSLVDINTVKVEGKEKIENLKDEILLVPNRKMLGLIKFNLWAYYFGQKVFKRDSVYGRIVKRDKNNKKIVSKGMKPNKFKNVFTEIIGEKPVYLDNSLIKKSEQNLLVYMKQKGYYNATVSSKVKTVLKRSIISYTVTPGKYSVIENVYYNGSDRVLDKNANLFAKKSFLKAGDRVDFEKLSEERDRLAASFRDSGFYYFNKSLIDIVVDTSLSNGNANVYFNIGNVGLLRNARQQTIQKVIVEMNFNQKFGRRDTITYAQIQYLFKGYNIKPNIINRSILLRPKNLFSQKDLEATYNKLLGLGLFKQVNISISPYKSDSIGKLAVYITLTPNSKIDYTFEPQVITSDKQTNLNSNDNNPRTYGLAASFNINNKNVFRNAEDFNIKFRTAAEKQFGNTSATPVVLKLNKLELARFKAANFESNLTFELLFPKLLGLRKLDLKPQLQQNRTSLNLTVQTEINTSYYRRSLPINFMWQTSYQTKDKRLFKFYYSPIQVSFNESDVDSGFINRLNNPADSIRLRRMFRNYIIASQKAGFEFNNQPKSPNNYWNIRTNLFELSGNMIELLYRQIGKSTGIDKEILGTPYFQYFRSDIDIVHYKIFAKNKTLVLRANIGYGVPFGNSVVLPFERQFYVGGSNSLRAWRPRIIGPGSYSNTSSIQLDKTGDIMLATTVEYRFAIAPQKLDGAFFLDAGNIWSDAKSANADSKFEFSTFYSQLALNTGIGLRFNLGFFIMRFDLGIKLYDPSKSEGNRWVIKDMDGLRWIIDNSNLTPAVGVPF